MQTSVPAIPTALPDVEVIAAGRRTTPWVALCRCGDPAPWCVSGTGPPHDAVTGDWLAAAAVTGNAGETCPGPNGSPVRWVLGLGAGEPTQWRTAGAALARALNARIAKDTDAGRRTERTVQLALPPDVDADRVGELVCGIRLGGYAYAVSGQPQSPRVRTVRLVVSEPDQRDQFAAVAGRSAVLAEATALARDLANAPSNVKDPAWLARMAATRLDRHKGLSVTVHDVDWLTRHGFGGVLAVGGGSARPPRLIELSWRPPGRAGAARRGRHGQHVVLVGKGITFDTGGISVKPSEGMHLMRTDMAGGAAVIAAMAAIARLGLDVHVTGLVPCAENHVSGSSYRPGDVVRHYGGITTEVTNTDAEGRMVMADALAYAVGRLRPDLLVDVATLTGATKVALGLRTGAVYASDAALAERVRAAGSRVGERWWRMPVGSDTDSVAGELVEAVRSDIADVRQCPPGPGGIAAAMFLQRFTGELPWAHLDIAGPARADRVYDEVVAGATGFAARTLTEFVDSCVD